MHSLPERGGNVVVLEDRPIVVEERRVRAWHHVEVVGGPRVLQIMDQSGEQRGENLHIRQPILKQIHSFKFNQ